MKLLKIQARRGFGEAQLRLVIFCAEFFHGLRLLLRRVEYLPVYTGSATTGVFNYPSDSETARAVGAGENELQGADFPLLALLLRLYDPSLQTTHVAVGSLPFDGTPVSGLTQARASSAQRRCFKFPTNSCLLRHCHRVSYRNTTRKSAWLPVP
jgi:hypothetical protein